MTGWRTTIVNDDRYLDDWAGGTLSDYEIFEEPCKITTSVTTGQHQLERDASCVITGAIINKLE